MSTLRRLVNGSASKPSHQTTPWSSIDWSNNTICIEAGDHTAKGLLTIPSTANGTATSRKVLRYTRTSSSDNDDEPWNQPVGSRAILKQLRLRANHWIIHRLSFDGAFTQSSPVLIDSATGACSNNIISRILVERTGGGGSISIEDNICDNNTVQNSVLRNAKVAVGLDVVGVDLVNDFGPDNTRIVNNEIYDHGAEIAHDSGSGFTNGTIVENNDVYKSNAMLTDCNGNFTPNDPDSPCMAAEALLGFKGAGQPGEANTLRVMHNRVWVSRKSDGNVCCLGGTDGQMLSISRYNGEAANNVLVQNNIFMHGQTLIQFISPTNGSNYDNVSIIGNILFNTKRFHLGKSSNAIHIGGSATAVASEFYLNTLISAPEIWGGKGGANNDWRCNAIIDAGVATGSLGSGVIFNDNVYYDATHAGDVNKIDQTLQTRANSTPYPLNQIIRTSAAPTTACVAGVESACFLYKVVQAGTSSSSASTYCTTLGCETTDGSMMVKAIRGPYAFKRKLRTVAGGETFVIPYAQVHADADEAGFCPGEGQANAIGLRTGIGVNDDVAWNGILNADLIGTGRTGTAGSLETQAGGGSEPPPGESEPFYGTPLSIPGLVEAEDFDNGGEGVAYHDVDAGNNGNSAYRLTDVDLTADQGASNGTAVSWARTDEWLHYTVNVASAGNYTLEVSVAANGQGGSFHIEFDGVDKTGSIAVPNTGGWSIWQALSRTVTLAAGEQTMRIVMDSVGPTNGSVGNFDYVRLSFVAGSTPFYGTPLSIPGLVEAEDFDNGGEGVAYHDVDAGNNGNSAYRSTDVDLTADQGASNGTAVSWARTGEWLKHTVNVATAGNYTLEVRVAANGEGGTFHIEFDDVDKTGPIAVPNTGGWSTWQTLSRMVTLDAGEQTMRLVMDSVGPTNGSVGNFDYVRLGPPIGTILREYWLDISGDSVAQLTSHPNYPDNPSGGETLAIFEGPLDWADNYGTRIRGYVHPPTTGNYVFWIASDNDSELWLSTDDNPMNRIRIAWVNGWTNSREWTKFASQQSVPITLTAGQRYYIEALHKEGLSGDRVAVGWQLPNATLERPIPGNRLSPP